jgi:two-component SAPR family response regulator
MNGPELARRIQQARASTRVLFVSGYTENTVARHGVLNDEASFLPKPYTREQLLTSVRQALTRA